MIYIITLQKKLDQGERCKLTTRTIGNSVGARFYSLRFKVPRPRGNFSVQYVH